MKKHHIFCLFFRKAGLPVLFILALPFCSCDLLRESPFEVSAWTPGDGFFPDFNDTALGFVFSHDADRISVERSFSLTEDGSAVTGYFSWEGRRCFFTPARPFKQNREYRVSILSDAMDSRGLSMDANFEGRFYTRSGGSRPLVLEINPPYDGVMDSERGRLVIRFSEPIDGLSLIRELTLSPAMTGSWALDEGGLKAEFTPAEPWRHNTLYQIRLSENFSSTLGLGLGSEYQSRFRTGTDTEGPKLEKVYALDAAGEPVFELAAAPADNDLWEGNYRLGLVFSEAVDSASLKSRINAPGAPVLIMDSPPGYGDFFVFRFAEKPGYKSRFSLSLAEGITDRAGNGSGEEYLFRIYADGPFSKTPSLAGLRLPLRPKEALSVPLASDEAGPAAYGIDDIFADLPLEGDSYGSDTEQETWIELYFDAAPGGTIELFSFMDLFRIEATNGALEFFPRSVRASGFTWEAPHAAWEGYVRIEVRGLLVNHPASGLVRFIVEKGLGDGLGNQSVQSFELPLVK
jgi:hypothetical protein